MNTRKSWLYSLILFGLFSVITYANTTVDKEPEAINVQFYKLLKGVEAQLDKSDVIYIDFMVNEKSEIIVLSTSTPKLDQALKSRLNYKTLEAGNLEYFKKYTIPVRIDKK